MILIVGGGLSGSLLAYCLAKLKNPPPFLLIESNPELCGNHTWSFHQTDLEPKTFEWIEPLVSKSWPQQEVRFPDHQRHFNQPYHSIVSTELNEKLKKILGDRIRLGLKVKDLQKTEVIFESGERISGQVVFDARGMAPFQTSECGYQKFVGIDLDLEEPHGIENPIIMDATCEQKDGFRFFYLIPWASNRILIEDTRYSNSSMIHLDEFHNEILEFCRKKNWKIKTIVRTESAALPIPLQASPSQLSAHGPVNIGLRAGYFHLTTGYSLANAASAAEKIADTFVNHPEGNIQRIHAELEALTQPIRKQAQFFALLNRMLFKAAVPERRWIIFSRFYRLSEELIFRFYRGSLKRTDQFRILMGKPPVPILSALRQINP